MSEIQKIIESGILESYCLGSTSKDERLLVEQYVEKYPEVREEINSIRKGIELYAESFAIEPPEEMRKNILEVVDKVAAVVKPPPKLKSFIEINHSSDAAEWQERVKGIEPPDNFEIHLHSIYSDKENFLFVAWVKNAVPVEVHEDLLESVLILEGTCTCKVGDEFIDLKAGDYFEIPLYKEHSFKITSDIPIKAILQRKMIA